MFWRSHWPPLAATKASPATGFSPIDRVGAGAAWAPLRVTLSTQKPNGCAAAAFFWASVTHFLKTMPLLGSIPAMVLSMGTLMCTHPLAAASGTCTLASVGHLVALG